MVRPAALPEKRHHRFTAVSETIFDARRSGLGMADIGSRRRKGKSYKPATLGKTAASRHGLLICCGHEVKLGQAVIVVCSACGSRAIDLAVTNSGRMGLGAD